MKVFVLIGVLLAIWGELFHHIAYFSFVAYFVAREIIHFHWFTFLCDFAGADAFLSAHDRIMKANQEGKQLWIVLCSFHVGLY